MEFKGKKKKYIDRIADCLNAYVTTNQKKPAAMFVTSALFDVLSGGYAKKDKAKFANVRVVVYPGKDLKFHFVETEYTFEAKK
jgi:hypothetical protein